jgi:NAD(P)-dependent dehydrogenase (short-subunit alcohol dehydrogenase family)
MRVGRSKPSSRSTPEGQFGDLDAVRLHPEAVSSTSGAKPFHLATSDGQELHEFYHSLEVIGDDQYHRKGDTIEIATVSLDDFFLTTPQAAYIQGTTFHVDGGMDGVGSLWDAP